MYLHLPGRINAACYYTRGLHPAVGLLSVCRAVSLLHSTSRRSVPAGLHAAGVCAPATSTFRAVSGQSSAIDTAATFGVCSRSVGDSSAPAGPVGTCQTVHTTPRRARREWTRTQWRQNPRRPTSSSAPERAWQRETGETVQPELPDSPRRHRGTTRLYTRIRAGYRAPVGSTSELLPAEHDSRLRRTASGCLPSQSAPVPVPTRRGVRL